jgi:hypothetical protein
MAYSFGSLSACLPAAGAMNRAMPKTGILKRVGENF